MMLIANIFGGLIVLFFGLVIRFMKASSLIAGFNTMSNEQKEKYDEKKLTRFVANMLIASAIVLLLPCILIPVFKNSIVIINVSWVLFTVILISGVVYMNTGNRFKK